MHLSDLQIDESLIRDARPAHADECERCRARFEELRKQKEEFAQRARPAAFAEAVLARRSRFGWLRVAMWLALPAAALLAFVWWPAGGVRYKGEPAAVELFVKSGEVTARFDPERRYQAGDALQVVYSAARALQLTAVNLDGEKLTILARDAIAPGRHKLDRSFVLDAAEGDERIILLFSDKLLDDADAEKAARGGQPVAAMSSFLIHR
jgi:hypothetical protein